MEWRKLSYLNFNFTIFPKRACAVPHLQCCEDKEGLLRLAGNNCFVNKLSVWTQFLHLCNLSFSTPFSARLSPLVVTLIWSLVLSVTSFCWLLGLVFHSVGTEGAIRAWSWYSTENKEGKSRGRNSKMSCSPSFGSVPPWWKAFVRVRSPEPPSLYC